MPRIADVFREMRAAEKYTHSVENTHRMSELRRTTDGSAILILLKMVVYSIDGGDKSMRCID